MLASYEVGIIVGLEVGRLARNCLDWYKLLQMAAVFDVLVADEDGIYDLNDFNDRLLLGLKGIFAEAELHQIQARMTGARLNKARRGEYRFRLPIGMEWDDITNKPRLTVDESVRHAVSMVFRLFRQIRSIQGVLHYLHREGLDLPYQRDQRDVGRIVEWRRPSYDALRRILGNPIYAGAYCYGKTETNVDPVHQKVHRRTRPREKWVAFLPDHHPGYITLDEFEENQRIIANNAYQFPQRQGAPRQGSALLQGIVLCPHCGHKMYVHYDPERAYYLCDTARLRFGDPTCNRANAWAVDGTVEFLFLRVLNSGSLELSRSLGDKLQREVDQVNLSWRQKLQRLAYEADVARRRYEAVDPENRLVAHTLETEWNQKLEALDAARKAYETQSPNTYELASSLEQMQQAVTHLRDYWFAESITAQDKKCSGRVELDTL
jgi:hypothetical protein